MRFAFESRLSYVAFLALICALTGCNHRGVHPAPNTAVASPDPGTVDVMIAQLGDHDGRKQVEATVWLVARPSQCIPKLKTLLNSDSDILARMNAVPVLLRIHSADAEKALVEAYSAGDPGHKETILYGIRGMVYSKGVVDMVREALAGSDPRQNVAALEALHTCPLIPAVLWTPILKAAHSQHYTIRESAVRILGEHNRPGNVAVLKSATTDPSADVRMEAVRGIARLRPAGWRESLMNARKAERDARVKQVIEELLGLGDRPKA